VWARAQGSPEQLKVHVHLTGEHPDQIDLQALVLPGSTTVVRAPHVFIEDGSSEASIRASRISVAARRLSVTDLQLRGLGRAELSFVYGRKLEELSVDTSELDVPRLLSMFGVVTPLHAAQANLAARLSHEGRSLSGSLAGQISDISFDDLQGSARANLTLQRGELDGTLGVNVPGAGATELTFEHVTAPLVALSDRDLEQLTGRLSMQGELQLERLNPLLPLLGLERGRGRLRYQLELDRERRGRKLPSWTAHLETRNLELVGQRQSAGNGTAAQQARRAEPWSLRGVDLNVDAALQDQVAEVHGKLFERDGDLARWQARFRDLDQVRDWHEPVQTLLDAPFDASLEVPERRLDDLPELIRPPGLSGTLALRLKAEGTLGSPRLHAHANLQGFGPGEIETPRLVRLDWDLNADYTAQGGRLAACARRARGAQFWPSYRSGRETLAALVPGWTGRARLWAA
ncbi:MAG TPA: hypothetical protein VG963_11965, partial [Polyangiaceae bacterium]|nr:hypothetical protein [Polyangiaceae bacterium]